MRRRVVITGIGCVTPLGTDVESMWQNLKEGVSGVGHTTVFNARGFPTEIAAEVLNWSVAEIGENPDRWKYRGRHSQFAAGAARKAVDDAGISGQVEPSHFGIYLGSGEGEQDFQSFASILANSLKGEQLDLDTFIKVGLETLHPMAELEQEPHMTSSHLAGMFGAQGPNAN